MARSQWRAGVGRHLAGREEDRRGGTVVMGPGGGNACRAAQRSEIGSGGVGDGGRKTNDAN